MSNHYYGYVWVCMGMFWYVWVCMGMYGYVWVSRCSIFGTLIFNCCRCWKLFNRRSNQYYRYVWVWVCMYSTKYYCSVLYYIVLYYTAILDCTLCNCIYWPYSQSLLWDDSFSVHCLIITIGYNKRICIL